MQDLQYSLSNDLKSKVTQVVEDYFCKIEVAFSVRIANQINGISLRGSDESQIAQVVKLFDYLREVGGTSTKLTPFFLNYTLHDFVQNLKKGEKLHPVQTIIQNRYGQAIQPKTAGQVLLAEAIEENDILFVEGPAGTGKTFIAVALAVAALESKRVERLCLVRPAVEAGEHLGYLPGDLKEKIAPYLRPLYDSMNEILPKEKFQMHQEANHIEVAPLAYMRGRTLKKAFVLLDEAQNCTVAQMKMLLTRIGTKSKVIITGDPTQIDLPKNQESGFAHAMKILKNIPGIGMITLDETDVLRHPLVKEIIKAYEGTAL